MGRDIKGSSQRRRNVLPRLAYRVVDVIDGILWLRIAADLQQVDHDASTLVHKQLLHNTRQVGPRPQCLGALDHEGEVFDGAPDAAAGRARDLARSRHSRTEQLRMALQCLGKHTLAYSLSLGVAAGLLHPKYTVEEAEKPQGGGQQKQLRRWRLCRGRRGTRREYFGTGLFGHARGGVHYLVAWMTAG